MATTTHQVTLTVELDVKDEEALRAATALALRPGGTEEPVTWTQSADTIGQLKILVGKELQNALAAHDNVFSDVRVAAEAAE